jgi:hypothetical protein
MRITYADKVCRMIDIDGMRGWSDGLHPLQLWFGVIDFLVGFSSLCMVPRCAFEVLVMFLALRFLLCL